MTSQPQLHNTQRSLFGPSDFRAGSDPAIAYLLKVAKCPYVPGTLIGEGAMARVFYGTHGRTGRPAAVKIPKDGPWAVGRFRQEVDAMDRLDHPHVMPLLEADLARRWYAMPWAECSLRQLRQRDPFGWPKLRKVLSSVAGGMMHAHANDCVHRDASPDNILRLRNGHWVLSDFGIAMLRSAARRGTETGQHFGTPDFSAPEVYADPKTATPAADAWSIGALASWFTSIRAGQNPTSEAGLAWLELIEHTMRNNPTERWTIPAIATYLDQMPPERAPVNAGGGALPDSCPRCGESAGLDAAQRCKRCGFLGEG